MKNLATCSPSEFFAQTVKVRHCAEGWLKATDILGIRKNLPKLPENATDEEKRAALAEQAKANALRIFDAVFEDHPKETLDLLALCCFVEPENVDDYPIDEYLEALLDMAESKAVLRFFTFLTRLGQTNTSPARKQ